MFKLKTKRLQLVPLSYQHLSLLAKDRRMMEKSLGLNPSEMLVSPEIQAEIDEVVPHWLAFTKKNPEQYAWGTTWEIVLSVENKSIGSIGLSGFPDKNGQVMVGYAIDKNYHKHGYATEALEGITRWAFASPDVMSIGAYTPKENIPSQKVLKNNHFQNMGEVIEENIDCYVWKVKKEF